VGGYTITGAQGSLAAGNYDFTTFNNGTLTVNPATLTVAANDAIKTYGDPNPAFTAGYDGFVLGQDASVLGGTLGFTTAAGDSSDVGNYAVTPGGLSSTDYTITYADGTLTVNPATLTVTANDAIKHFGQGNPDFTASYDGFVLGQDASALGGSLAFTTTALGSSYVGGYAVTPGGLSSTNYAITFNTGTLTILAFAGDVNQDGSANSLDIDAIYYHFDAPASSQWKVDGDDQPVGQNDVTYELNNYFHTNYGDANLDGKTDFLDFQTLLNDWQAKNVGWAGGDFNGDGVVDFLDFQNLLNHWNPSGWNFAPEQVSEQTTPAGSGIGRTTMAVGSQPLLMVANQIATAAVSVSTAPATTGILSSGGSLIQAGATLAPARSGLNSESIHVADLLAISTTSSASVYISAAKATVPSHRTNLADGSWTSDNDKVDLLTPLIKPVVA
jgi:hypothetical protein